MISIKSVTNTNDIILIKSVTNTNDIISIKPAGKADSYGNEKLIRKWTRSVFFLFFSILWEREWSRFV